MPVQYVQYVQYVQCVQYVQYVQYVQSRSICTIKIKPRSSLKAQDRPGVPVNVAESQMLRLGLARAQVTVATILASWWPRMRSEDAEDVLDLIDMHETCMRHA